MIGIALVCLAVAANQPSAFWFVAPSPEGADGPSLCIVGPPASMELFTPMRLLAHPPSAMASAGTAVWILPGGGVAAGSKTLRALRARWDPGLVAWLAEPSSGMARLPNWPGAGVLTCLIASQQGPTVVLQPEQSGDAEVWSLRRGAWRLRSLLRSDIAEQVVLGAGEGDAVALLLRGEQSWALTRSGTIESQWQRTELLGFEGLPRDLLFRDGVPLLGLQQAGDRRAFGFVQDGKLLPWAVLDDVPESAWLVRGDRGLMLLDQNDSGPRVRLVDPSGLPHPWQRLERATGLGSGLWSVLVLLGIAVVVLAMLLAGRGVGLDALPDGLRVAPLSRRVVAVLLDLIPGLLTCVAVLGVGSIDVFSAILAGPMPSTLPTLLIMATVTACWGFVWEASRARTPGKMLLGLAVIQSRGEQLRWWQTLLRNVLKGVVVLAPPLAVLVILTPLAQAPGDIVARTIVVDVRGRTPENGHAQ